MSYLSLGGGSDEPASFTPPKAAAAPGNSNLSALFGLNDQINNNPNSNQALTYTAPKPPGKSVPKQQQQASGGGSAASGVACAVAVTAYRYVKGQNVNQGKLGVALLRNVAEKDYKILMYVTKQQPVSTTQINSAFQFTVQANNYASFNDDQKQTWTVLFANTAQLHDFAKQVCLAKFFTSPQTPSANTVQELVEGDKQNVTVETGDSLEMKYSGWLVNKDGSLGNMFDSNHNSEKTFRFKIGRGKVIKGWDTGMIGMRSGGKRFLIIPSHLAYGQKAVGNRVPPDSTLAFEVDLLRVKQSKDNSSVKSAESIESIPQATVEQNPPNPAVLPATLTTLTPENTSEPVKGRTASLRDQLSNASSDTSKAALASRMARMGQAMLPNVAPQADVPSMLDQVNMMPGNEQPAAISPSISQPLSRSSTPGYNPTQQPVMQLPQQSPQVAAPYQGQQVPQPSQFQPPQMGLSSQPQMHSLQQQQQFQPPPQSYNSPQHHQNMLQNQMQPNQSLQTYMEQQAMPSHASNDPQSMYHPAYRQTLQYPQPQGYGSELMPVLVSETRQQSAEMRLLQEKVDKVSGMVEEVKKITEDTQLNQPKLSPSQTLDAEVIMLNVQRIMKENEQLKQTVSDKNKQIEQQNGKISDLLQQNQKYVEKSNLMLEQRNDSFKESFTQSQARSLQLEQDKVELTQRLSDATSKVSELTLEITNLKQKEGELKQKFKEIYMKEKERAEEAEEKNKELEEKLSEIELNLQTVSSSGASAKSEVDKLKKEINSMKESRDSDKQNYKDSLAQSSDEKSALLQRLNELQSKFEAKLEEMQESKETASLQSKQQDDQVLNLREKLLAMQTRLTESQESNETNEQKISLFQQKFAQMRTAYEDQKSKLQEALSEVEETSQYKEAYGRLRGQAATMKGKYEAKILELKEELESKEEISGGSGGKNVVEEVKKIMNVIFQRARTQINIQEQYAGADVLKILMDIIKKTTLSLIQNQSQEKEDESASDEDEGSPDPPVEVEENRRTSAKSNESVKDADANEDDDEEQEVVVASPNEEEAPCDGADSTSQGATENKEPVAPILATEQEESNADAEDAPKDAKELPVAEASEKKEDPPELVNENNTTTDNEEEEAETEGNIAKTQEVQEADSPIENEDSAGDFVVVAQTENKSNVDDPETTEQEGANKTEEKLDETVDEKSLSPPAAKPARNISTESLSSLSEDRKPPPLFDEDSDGDDLDWLS